MHFLKFVAGQNVWRFGGHLGLRKTCKYMNKRVNHRLTMSENVVHFLLQPEIKLTKGGLKLLQEVINNNALIKELGRNQVSGQGTSSSGVKIRAAAANELRAVLRTIAEAAAGLEFPDAVESGATKQFQMPATKRYLDLLNSARAFAQDLEAHRDYFVDHLGEEQVARLPALIAQIESATDRKSEGRVDRRNSTVALDLAGKRSLRLVRLLDPIVRVVLRDQPALYATWLNVSRVERIGTRKQARSTGGNDATTSPALAEKPA